jgi:hypothetical protein
MDCRSRSSRTVIPTDRGHPKRQIGSPCRDQQGQSMAGMRMSMRKIREVLQLTHELGLSVRQVREVTGVVRVCEARQGGRDHVADPAGDRRRRVGAAAVHAAGLPRGLDEADSRLDLSPTMRQTYVAGDKLFVDWAGGTVPIIDPMTGEVQEAHPFVAVLCASSYTYPRRAGARCCPTGLVRTSTRSTFLSGCPILPCPINLKAGITKPSRYEPGVNRMISPTTTASSCCRRIVRRPRDKANVGSRPPSASSPASCSASCATGVSSPLAELNDAVRDCVTEDHLLASLDRPALKGLPGERYQYAEWKRCAGLSRRGR